MQIISLASTKGGVGKSTLAVNLAGALATLRGPVALSDEDATMQTSRRWVERGSLPITIVASGGQPDQGARYWVIDVEGRPSLPDMADLTRAGTVLIPSGANGTELEPTAELWDRLAAAGGDMTRVRVVITKAPPTGAVGQAARDHLRSLGMTCCETVVRSYAAHQRAQEQRVLVKDVSDARTENAWADVLSLAVEVI